MKKIRIAVIIMVAAVVAALGIFFAASVYNNKKNDKEKADAEKLVMFSFDPDDAEYVKIHNESGEFDFVYDSMWGWILDGSDEFLAEPAVIATIVENMAVLKADKILENSSDLSKFGFDEPIEITVSDADSDYKLIVGKPTATYESIYMMKENDSSVYLVSYANGALFCLDKDSLKSKYFSDFLASEVESFCLWEGGEKDENILFRMKMRDDGLWCMTAPFEDDSVYSTDVSKFISASIRDEVDSFVEEHLDEKDYGKYGFDKPSYVFEMSGSGKSIKVIFGNETGDGDGIYVLFANNGQVATAYKGSVSTLGYTTSDFINTDIFSESISSVDKLEVKLPGHTADIAMNASDREYSCNGKSIDGNDEEAVAAFTDFYNSFNNAYLSIIAYASVIDNDTEPKGDAEVYIKYSLSNNSTVVMEYIPVSDDPDDGYYAVKDGDYTGYIVDKGFVKGITDSYENMEKYLR